MEQTCYRLCAWRMFRVSCSIRSRIRQSASAIVLWAPLLFSQWVGSLLSCSFVRRTSCFLTEGAKTSHQSSFQTIRIYSCWLHCQKVGTIKRFQVKMKAELFFAGEKILILLESVWSHLLTVGDSALRPSMYLRYASEWSTRWDLAGGDTNTGLEGCWSAGWPSWPCPG